MEQITIAGKVFNAPLRYEEGHELSAGEASALNQTYHENLRNNFAKRVKDAIANGYDQDGLQAEFDAYAEKYEFGVRTGGGGAPRDPVMAEAMSIAKSMINAALKKKGVKINSVDPAAKTAKAKQLIEKRPDIMALARQRVEEAQLAATDDLSDFISEIPQKAEAAE